MMQPADLLRRYSFAHSRLDEKPGFD